MEVDLEIPEEKHDFFNDYPLAPENFKITPDMISEYSNNLADQFNKKVTANVKLTPNLLTKTKYVIHYRNLQQYLSLGVKLVKIHRILQFEQSAWLQPYINCNTQQRQKANNSFEKDFFKLLNNSVYGKTLESLRSRVDIRLAQTEKKVKKLLSSPAFHAYTIFNDDLTGIQMKKTSITLNRPLYTGFCILDLSKFLMYNFNYFYMKPKYNDKVNLIYTDTDSLCYEFTNINDIYEDMATDFFHYDSSEYPSNHKTFNTVNKKVLGKMKDELCGTPAVEFIGLRSKMYSLLTTKDHKKNCQRRSTICSQESTKTSKL